jgi:hypothetical protein
MQKTIWTGLVVLMLCIGFFGCDNELNVTADWKEVTILYGALNPTVSKNYVRVQRAYLDETTSALAFSEVRDSLYFDTLTVFVEEFQEGVFKRRIPLKRVDGNIIGIPKDTGFFYDDENILYELDADINPSQYATDWVYKITVENPATGDVTTASTASLGNIQPKSPISPSGGSIYVYNTSNHVVPVNFQEGKHARAYRVSMDIRIEEYKKDNPTQKEIKELEWVLVSSGTTESLGGFRDGSYKVQSRGFFALLKNQLSVDPTVERRLVDYDFTFYGISDDFNTFLAVLEPSNGIVQKKPEFTNVQNGLGIFTSRNITKFENLRFNATTLPQIQTSELTEDLGFVP